MEPNHSFISYRSQHSNSHYENFDVHSARPRRPRSSIHSLLVANKVNTQNQWNQLKISKGSWVLMQPRRRKLATNKSIYTLAWKGKIKDFKIEVGKTTIMEVLVQHVYMHKELVLSRGELPSLPSHRSNCKCSFVLHYIVFPLLHHAYLGL